MAISLAPDNHWERSDKHVNNSGGPSAFIGAKRGPSRGLRLFVTVFLVCSAFSTTNVVRETYLAMALGESLTVRVDPYLGLHPDLFEIPGRGSYINSNPGASFLGAIPYAIARPALDVLFRVKPSLVSPKPAAAYEDPRPNRTNFMNRARARGLDVKLGLAAIITAVGLMTPLAALAALLMMRFLTHRGINEQEAALWSLAFAFATPVLFRSAFLNQNLLLAYAVGAAYVLMVGLRPRTHDSAIPPSTLLFIGALLGFGVVLDYSAAPMALVFAAWIFWRHIHRGTLTALRGVVLYGVGALPPLAMLFIYQWAAFGVPWFPAQRYMPATDLSVIGWNGLSWPTSELLTGNLIDLRYGLFAFCPLLIAALAARRRTALSAADGAALPWVAALCLSLYLFSSANQFANLQWNTGVRYMVPAVPILFVAALPVLRAWPRVVTGTLLGASGVISLLVSMTRESIPDAVGVVATTGPTLPVFIVLEKMASGYPALDPPAWLPFTLLVVLTAALWMWWRTDRALPHAQRAQSTTAQ